MDPTLYVVLDRAAARGRSLDDLLDAVIEGARAFSSPLSMILLFNIHHIVSDGWSLDVFVRELAAFYAAFHEGRPAGRPELPVRYSDYAIWQRRWLRGDEREAQLAYWRRQLAGAPEALELPTDRPRPPVRTAK